MRTHSHQPQRTWTKCIAPSIFGLLVGGCIASSGSASPILHDLVPTVVPLPPGVVFGLAWLGDGSVVTNYSPSRDQSFGNSSLWRFRPDGSAFTEISLPEYPECRQLAYIRPVALLDGRLAYDRECRQIGKAPGNELEATIDGVDLETGEIRQLAPIVKGVGASGIAGFDWDSSRKTGLISIGSGICQGIEWVDQAGPRPIDLVVSDSNKTFNLAEEFNRTSTDCSATGTAKNPTMSPADGQVAFFASPSSVGMSGQARLDAPSNVYVADVELKTVRQALGGVHPRGGLAWSPNGRWLAFSGEVADVGAGVWLFDTATSKLQRITAISIDEIAWSPDGLKVAGVTSSTDFNAQLHVDVFELGGLLNGTSP